MKSYSTGLAATCLLLCCLPFAAAQKTWIGSSDMNWFEPTNWSPIGVPADGDAVIVDSASSLINVLVTNSTAALSSLTVSNRTMTFSNWMTVVTSTIVTIRNGAILTLPPPFTTSQMSNRVWIVCTNLMVEAGGRLDADGKGYAAANGPGSGGTYANFGGGGGHGGVGGVGWNTTGGAINDLTNAPFLPGSGGGATGGGGGGVVRVEASGDVTVDGIITANGNAGTVNGAGGGAGGSIFVACQTFGGSNGLLAARGGNGENNAGGGGSGGRIAVTYAAMAGQKSLRFNTSGGSSSYGGSYLGDWGTLYLSDRDFLSEILQATFTNVTLYMAGVTNWSANTLLVTNSSVTFGENGFQLYVSNDVVVGSNSVLGLGPNGRMVCDGNLTVNNGTMPILRNSTNVTVDCRSNILLNGGSLYVYGGAGNAALNSQGNVALTNRGKLYVYSAPTNVAGVDYGALVSVTGDVVLGSSGSWIYPYSSTTNGGSVLFRLQNLVVDTGTNGGFYADGLGYRSGYGPGKGSLTGAQGSGGGHGGKGGTSSTGSTPGNTNDSVNAPIYPGSAGVGGTAGGSGGGLIRIEAGGGVTLNGTLTARGVMGIRPGGGSAGAGGGAGGGIFIACATFGGNGRMDVSGGNGMDDLPGGGGGGRISVAIGLGSTILQQLLAGQDIYRLFVYTNHVDYLGTISVTNGVSGSSGQYNGQMGTRRFLATNYCLTVAGAPGNYGAPQPMGYGTDPYLGDSALVTNTVVSPADQSNGLRHACLGWALADVDGTPIASDVTTQAVFNLTTNLVLTWNWTNEYQLTVLSANTNGTVNSNAVNGWYTNGTLTPEITATPTSGYTFVQWVGDIPAGQETNNPLTVTMGQARTLVAQFGLIGGETKTWTGTGNWTSTTNWTPPGMPAPQDSAIIDSGSVLLSDSRQAGSLTVNSSATLTFTNWTTKLTVTSMTIKNGGVVTLPPFFTTSQMSNRVWIVCTNLTVEAGGKIDADGRGYAGLNGPGAASGSPAFGSGGGHGGVGGMGYSGGARGVMYDLTNAPALPGSGGGAANGREGGGVIRVDAAQTVTINGTVTAGGNTTAPANAGGGGSGGSIWISCETFGGDANGLISVKGGDGNSNGGAGGGGGRIAVTYGALAQKQVRFVASGGGGNYSGDPGTVYMADSGFLAETLQTTFTNVVLYMGGVTNWSANTLLVTNCRVIFGEVGFQLYVSNDITVAPNSVLGLGPNSRLGNGGNLAVNWGAMPMLRDSTNVSLTCASNITINGGSMNLYGGAGITTLNCGVNMVLTNGGKLYVYSAPTNTGGNDYGALVNVTEDVVMGSSGSWIYPSSSSNNGGSVLFRMRNLTINTGTNGGINADGQGFVTGYGPGKAAQVGPHGGGGGHGGKGGAGASGGASGGVTNDSIYGPMLPGSSGYGGNAGGTGGGLIRIEAAGAVALNGALKANGAQGLRPSGSSGGGGGGAGGGIFVNCGAFSGSSTGQMSAVGADGLDGLSGGGGGGRIAVWSGINPSLKPVILDGSQLSRVIITNSCKQYFGQVSVTNGIGYTNLPPGGAEPGTAVFILPNEAGAIIFFR